MMVFVCIFTLSALAMGIASDGFLAGVVPLGPRHDKNWPERDYTKHLVPASNTIPLPNTPDIKKALLSTFKIRVQGCGRQGYGSGWVWKRGELVTNAHVAAGADKVIIENGKQQYSSQVLRVDRKRDIAFVSAPIGLNPIPIKASSGYGWAVGYPGGGARKIVATNLFQIYGKFRGPGNTFASWQKLLQGGSELYPGMSGGPILDKDGYAVGTNSMTLQGSVPNLLALPASELSKIGSSSKWTKKRCSFGS